MPRGFQQIGDLTKTALSSPPNSASTAAQPRTSSPSSVTTGAPSRAVMALAQTGTALGANGSASTSISTVTDLGRLMAGDDPKATDKAVVACLPQSVRSCLRAEFQTRYVTEGGCEITLKGYKIERPLTSDELTQCRLVRETALAPASCAEIIKLLTLLKFMTASGVQNQQDIAAQIACYADELMGFPSDLVRHVLSTHPNISTFWPAWSEIFERLSRKAHRQHLFKALSV